jgi:putative ATP-dependent endonuclease of OLD family
VRISHITISDFRSVFPDDRGQPLSLDLAEGMNALVGRNNCGKSNVLRAISLALDPKATLDPAVDLPVNREFATPTVELTFELDDGEDEQEIRELAARWRAAAGARPESDPNQIRVAVTYRVQADGGYVREVDVLPEARPGVAVEEHGAVVQRLFGGIRVVSIASGQGLDTFLEGNFRAVLHTVLSDRLRDEVAEASQSRLDYIAGLEQRILEPLRSLLGERLKHLFREIGGLALRPDVPDLEQTLARVAVSVTDAVETPLESKGTGVRGGLLVALLNYLADNTSQGLVFLIEEPEAFLHPAAQEDLRDTLEEIAARPDITTIVSSHSPFIASRRPEGRVVALAKDIQGRTRIEATAQGDSDHAHLIGDLIRPATFEDLLKAAMEVSPGARAVLIVEGQGDAFCLQLAAARAGRPELVADLDIRPATGASRLVLQAVVAREAMSGNDIPVAVLLDNDQPGRDAAKLLRSEKFGFDSNRVASYAEVLPALEGTAFPYEAEDLWPVELIERFIEQQGDSVVSGSLRRPDGTFHYDLDLAAKEELEAFLHANVEPEHCSLWVTLIEWIRSSLGLPIPEPPSFDSSGRRVAEGRVIVLPGSTALTDYRQSGIVVVSGDAGSITDITHVAFYESGEILDVVPAVKSVFAKVTFNHKTADKMLKAPGDAARIGEFITERIGASLTEGESAPLILLTPEDSTDTVRLRGPIANTKTARGDRAVAWIIGPTEIALDPLLQGASTTTELDEFIANHHGGAS